eukprot:COSAG04_NODE_475_length_13749_cov_11.148498_2_plen_32_part_00
MISIARIARPIESIEAGRANDRLLGMRNRAP